ncbi:Uncharacterised protein [Shewanella putrefaciens]|nr:Uncharacterised protein [Shewanella putrefaciens]
MEIKQYKQQYIMYYAAFLMRNIYNNPNSLLS